MRIWKAILLMLMVGLMLTANNGFGAAPPGLVAKQPPPPPLCYLTISSIPGGQIAVYSLNHKIALTTSGSGDAGAGSLSAASEPFTITKKVDQASPSLYRAATSGRHLQEVTLNFANEDGSIYFRVELSDAVVTAVRSWFPNSLDQNSIGYGHMEDVSFSFKKIKWTDLTSGNQSEWDITHP